MHFLLFYYLFINSKTINSLIQLNSKNNHKINKLYVFVLTMKNSSICHVSEISIILLILVLQISYIFLQQSTIILACTWTEKLMTKNVIAIVHITQIIVTTWTSSLSRSIPTPLFIFFLQIFQFFHQFHLFVDQFLLSTSDCCKFSLHLFLLFTNWQIW